MKENRLAKVFMIVAIIVAIGGFITAIVLWYDWDFLTGLIALVSTFFTCLFFFTIAEVIQLLQDAADTQRDILRHLTGDSGKSQKSHTTIVHDIEANLPPM